MGWGGDSPETLAAVRDSLLFCSGVSRAVIGAAEQIPAPPQAMGSTREAEGSTLRGLCRAMK